MAPSGTSNSKLHGKLSQQENVVRTPDELDGRIRDIYGE